MQVCTVDRTWNFLLSLSSEKLGVNATTVQHGVQGMMYLLTECSKLMVGGPGVICICMKEDVHTVYMYGPTGTCRLLFGKCV